VVKDVARCRVVNSVEDSIADFMEEYAEVAPVENRPIFRRTVYSIEMYINVSD